jgi:tetratricopeptide (TPR) repeat protein
MDSRRWEEIQATFDELVTLDEGSRASRLAALGATDRALRQAVEVLLAADAEADQRLAPLEAAFFPHATPAPDPLSLAGRTVSHFRVVERLGAGGMGVVYRAEDTRLGRAVALKFRLPQLSLDAPAKARFLQEAHSAAALDHPNLCTIHEVGETDDGQPFLAMALYPGETLKARLDREGPLPVGDALAIVRQIAEGLAYAHAAGIVHRDLKPGNVMLVPNGPVKILDFGLAKARNQSLSTASARWGTVAYMAPEQIRGEAVDARTDLWALGVVLFEMLTGRRPFAGEHELALAPAILRDQPLPPSTLRADVPTALEDIVLTLLQKDPANRYPAAAELLAHLVGAGTRAESAVRSGRTRSFRVRRLLSGRRQWTVGAAAAVLIVGVLLGAALLVGRHGGRDGEAASRVVVLPFENRTAVTELDPLGAMAAEWVTQGLTQVPFLTVLDTRGPQATARMLHTAGGLVAAGHEIGAGVVVSGSYFLQGDSLHFQVQIASTGDGSILLGIGGVTAPRDRPLEGIEQVRQRVAAGLASLLDRDVTTFQTGLRQPPTYEAYREYVEGLEEYMASDMAEAARRFQQAATLDPTFLTARIWTAQSGMFAGIEEMDEAWARRADSMISGLRLLRDRLAPFDRARLDFVVAVRDGDLLEAYRATLRLVDAAPGSIDARREAALTALRALRPRDALRRLEELDLKSGLMREWEGNYWFHVALAQHLLGEYKEELTAIQRFRQLYPADPASLSEELRPLAALGRIAEVDSMARAELPGSGHADLIAFSIAGELMAHGHPEAAQRLARYVSDHPGAPPPSQPVAARAWLHDHRALEAGMGIPLCYVADRLRTRSVAQRARDEWVHSRSELALLLGDAETAARRAAQLRAPDAHGTLLARIMAAQGKVGAARTALEQWEGQMFQARGTLNGLEIERASVLVRIGEMDRALKVLSEGIGLRALPNTATWWNGHAYPDFAPLFGDSRFQALIKPRG